MEKFVNSDGGKIYAIVSVWENLYGNGKKNLEK